MFGVFTIHTFNLSLFSPEAFLLRSLTNNTNDEYVIKTMERNNRICVMSTIDGGIPLRVREKAPQSTMNSGQIRMEKNYA